MSQDGLERGILERMGDPGQHEDALEQWLRGDGLAALDGILGGALDVVTVVDHTLRVRYANWTGPGLTREAVIKMSALDLMPPGDREIAREVITRTLRTGVGDSFETYYHDERGVSVWVVRVGPVRHGGEVIGAVAFNTDVTEQRRVAVDRDRFFALSLDMLVVISPSGHLKRINPAFGIILGYDVADLVGKPFADFLHPDDVSRTYDVFATVKAGLKADDFENRYRRRDETYRVLSWRGTVDPLTGDVHAVARDITDQRTMEAQLRHAQKMEAVGQLAGGIAHDFNNLMQAVLGNVELATLKAASLPAVQDHLHEIADAGQRAADLTRQLLTFSRRQPMHLVLIDLNLLLQRLMQLLHRLLPENIAVQVRAADGLASVTADPTQLEQVVINLCVNARDAMERGGTLSIETDNVLIHPHDCELYPWARPGRFVRLRVTDDGVGMTAEVRDRVFEPFFTTKSTQRGTGLGLATVYGIIQQHGGLIHVYSEVGHGTTFKVYLPADERVAATAVAPEVIDEAQLGGDETILVAEDEQVVRRPLLQVLERAGYRTLAAANGLEAIRLLSEHPSVALVVLDVVMPELGGPQAWAQMQQARPDLRVIFTSGYADDRYRALLPDNAEVLEKPFGTQELLRAVRRNLDLGSLQRGVP